MQLSIRGKNEILTKKEVRYIISRFGEYILGNKLSKNIYIEVHYCQDFDRHHWGFCLPIDDQQKPRSFEILLSPHINRKSQVKTIAHELAHVYQFSRGLLKQSHGENFKWMGKLVDTEDMDYHRIPWEIQAHSMEDELYQWYRKNVKQDVDKLRPV